MAIDAGQDYFAHIFAAQAGQNGVLKPEIGENATNQRPVGIMNNT